MNTYNNGAKCKQHVPFNRSVYFRQNACNFIPNCAFERLVTFEKFPSGHIVRIFESDSGQHKRAVLFPCQGAQCGIAGILYETKTGRIVWGEVNPADRAKGNYKQLKAIVRLLDGARLWSDYQTADLLKAAGMHKGEAE